VVFVDKSVLNELNNQVDFLEQYVNSEGIIVDEIIEDSGSRLNYNQKKWNNYWIIYWKELSLKYP